MHWAAALPSLSSSREVTGAATVGELPRLTILIINPYYYYYFIIISTITLFLLLLLLLILLLLLLLVLLLLLSLLLSIWVLFIDRVNINNRGINQDLSWYY